MRAQFIGEFFLFTYHTQWHFDIELWVLAYHVWGSPECADATCSPVSLSMGGFHDRYFHGFHWRALLAWVIGVFPTMPGFIMSVQNPTTYNSWIKVYNMAFFVGACF